MPVVKAIPRFSAATTKIAKKHQSVYLSRKVRYDTFGKMSARTSLKVTTVNSNVNVTEHLSETAFNEITNERLDNVAVMNKMIMIFQT